MAEKLTPQQLEAVMNRGGKLLVSAAAGSGKTKVLVDRLMRYVTDPVAPANLDDFLIITYTKAAAAELRGKIGKKLVEMISSEPGNRHLQRQMQRLYLAKISTVHSFCADILREYAYRLDISADFRVADEMECEQLQMLALEQIINSAYDTAGESQTFRAFVDTQGVGRNDHLIPQIILKVYNSAMCHLEPDGWLQWCLQAAKVDGVTDAGQTVWGAYLISDLKNFLRLHMDSLAGCRQKAQLVEGFEKPVSLLDSTLCQLNALYSCKTWDEIVRLGRIDFGRLTFPKNCSDIQLSEQIKAVRNACKKALEKKLAAFTDSSEQVLYDLEASSEATQGLVELVTAFSEQYSKLKRNRRVLDFSDLEHKMLDLLLGKKRTGPTVAAAEISDRFREIMVDEYQDSNGVQDAIFGVLTQKRSNCFMVGDVKQSIYQFRLADPGIFIEKYNCYMPADSAEDGMGRKVLLSSNFRSSRGVISAVNFVFSLGMSRDVGGLVYGPEEMLREGVPHIPIGEPEVELYCVEVERDTYAEEAAFTAKRIQELLDGTHFVREDNILRPVKASDIVILLRSPGSVGREFQYALEQRGIRCFTGDSSNLLRVQEIVTLKSILQVIDNPLQDIPLLAAMASPVFAFTADELAMLRSKNRKVSIFDAVRRDMSEKSRHFLDVLTALRTDAKMDSVCELLVHIFQRTDLLSIYCAMSDGQERCENLHMFYQIASDFEKGGRRGLSNFLEYLDAMEERGVSITTGTQDNDCVTIMSIHKSKGLEFPVVFLCGLSRRFNEESARAQVLCHKELGLGLSCVNIKQRVRYPTVAKRAITAKILSDGISEELRVLYVAMTRAKDRLIMTYAVKNLAADLLDIAMRSEFTPRELLTSGVVCPGEWVLQAAMSRVEAGELFALCGSPGNTVFDEPEWKIRVVQAPEVSEDAVEKESTVSTIAPAQVEKLRAGLSFQYPYLAATKVPSKQTATQLKGRLKDQEISQGLYTGSPKDFRSATFSTPMVQGKEYGTAMHTLMQYIRYENCWDNASVTKEVECLVGENLLTQEQAVSIDCNLIATFFQSPIGVKLREGGKIIREFKFSVLVDGEKYYPDVPDEKILLQGVIDCAIIEESGITLIDFKTDYVTEDTVEEKVRHYAPQVNAYVDALEAVFERKVQNAYLYFFQLGEFILVSR